MIITVEQAYDAIARYLLSFVGKRRWDSVACKLRIYTKMVSGSQCLIANGVSDESGGFEKDPNAMWEGLDAAAFLRDDFLRTTGERIWGLTFTLYPDRKFNIEYDYNKPEDYEETDETVNLSQALEDLQKQGVDVFRKR
ncbi:hypothetical protein H6CHR_05005 [Variovorax sp. PBL-H6]|uniref:hypothetical protein n=1 Tax=Variovorax sp. PBL-H6 TaxID=434009 RepID=UPI00131645FE|nr:hypothetical protein [Variovorax sp. PBL-H6]VTU37588.1 hypothetical protein H6CHR_05005 [Variovorax sp. PBL-H6]